MGTILHVPLQILDRLEESAFLLRLLLAPTAIASIIALILFAIKPLIKNKLSKRFQYFIWILVFVPLFFAGFLGKVSLYVPQNPDAPISSVYNVVNDNVLTGEDRQDRTMREGVNYGYIPNSSEHIISISQVLEWVSSSYFLVFALQSIWIIGFFRYLLKTLLDYTRFRDQIEKGWRLADLEENQIAVRIYGKPVDVYKSPAVSSPMLMGLIFPKIILPEGAYTQEHLENILAHELMHLKHGDIVIKWYSMFLNAVHWFNPIIYMVRREMNRACELACDEAVIKDRILERKQSYANSLVDVAADSRWPKKVLSVTMVEDKQTVKERISAILSYRKNTKAAMAMAVCLALLLSATTLVLGADFKERPPIDPPHPRDVLALFYPEETEFAAALGWGAGEYLYSKGIFYSGKTISIWTDDIGETQYLAERLIPITEKTALAFVKKECTSITVGTQTGNAALIDLENMQIISDVLTIESHDNVRYKPNIHNQTIGFL